MLKTPSISLCAAAAAMLFSTVAPAAETPTRAEYVDQVETICKPQAEATERAMKGVRADVRAERLKVAAGKFAKANSIFAASRKKLVVVPRPSADARRLAKWFSYLRQQESYLEQITAQLRLGHAIKAQRLIGRFIIVGNRANNTVLPLGFNYCSFKFSRYG